EGFGAEVTPIRTQVHRLAGAVGEGGLFLANQGDLAITTAADRTDTLRFGGLSLATGGSLSSDASLSLESALESNGGQLRLVAKDQLLLLEPARLRLLADAQASLLAQGGPLRAAAGSAINVGTGSLDLSGQGLVLQGVLDTAGRLGLDGGSATLALLPYLTAGQQQALSASGIDPASLDTNLVLAGSITSAAAEGVFLPNSQLLAVLGRLETTAAAAPLQLASSSAQGILVLGTLSSAGPLTLDPVGRLFTDVPSLIRTTGRGLLSIHEAIGTANLNGTLDAGAGGVDLQVNGTLSLAGPIRSEGPVSIQALGINLASSGSIVSQGDLSLSATGEASGSGLQLAGLLVAGGSVAAPALAASARRPVVKRVAIAGQPALESTEASVQRQDIQLDPVPGGRQRHSRSQRLGGGAQHQPPQQPGARAVARSDRPRPARDPQRYIPAAPPPGGARAGVRRGGRHARAHPCRHADAHRAADQPAPRPRRPGDRGGDLGAPGVPGRHPQPTPHLGPQRHHAPGPARRLQRHAGPG
ncbi:MAG: hypothetical protein EBU88_16990, partial [Acidobacteria bacterium]|nr:hypothetical protein [Acidobacteriota bacterium]